MATVFLAVDAFFATVFFAAVAFFATAFFPAVAFFAGEPFLAVVFFAGDVFLAVVFLAAAFLAVVLRAVVFFAGAFLAVVLRAVVFFAGLAFLAAVAFFAVAFLPALRAPVVFLAVVFFAAVRFAGDLLTGVVMRSASSAEVVELIRRCDNVDGDYGPSSIRRADLLRCVVCASSDATTSRIDKIERNPLHPRHFIGASTVRDWSSTNDGAERNFLPKCHTPRYVRGAVPLSVASGARAGCVRRRRGAGSRDARE